MKISILTANLSSNCVGRSYMLAKILQRNYSVEIIGPMFGKQIWEPVVDDTSVTYKSINFKGVSVLNIFKWIKLYREIDGDVIYANKPLLSSFGLGLVNKLFTGKRLILDIDDWEMGFLIEKYKSSKSIIGTLSISPFYTLNIILANLLVPLADYVTVSNKFLKNKFGGKLIPHGRDTDVFNPKRFDVEKIKESLKIPKRKKIVSFIGTAQPYKGIEELIGAFQMIESEDTFLLIVGLGSDEYSDKIRKMIHAKSAVGSFMLLGKQPFKRLPEFVAISDVIVIPQRENVATKGQLPVKLFDAMSLEIPIISTDVGDIRSILKSEGWYFTPGNVVELRKKIEQVLQNYDEAKAKARNAREICIKNYSWNYLEIELNKIFEKCTS